MLHCNDIDGLMVDWLYGELDDSKASMVQGHVESCARCTAEQAAFSRTRELVSALPTQEPPSSLTAMLVREAALSAKPTTAVAPEPTSGGFGAWLSKLFAPLMHPAAAAVATLVLVIGVGGLIYINQGDDQFAEPTTSSADSTVATRQALQTEGEAVAALPEPPPAIASEEKALDEGELSREQDKSRVADLLAKDLEQDQKLRNKTEKSKRQVGKRPAQKAITAAAPGSTDPLAASATEDPAFEGDGDDRADSFGFRGEKADSWVLSKEAQLVRAFKGDNCREAAKIANDIRERKPEHYNSSTAELDAVKKCRYYVNNERKRRVAKKKAKSTGASSTKAKGAKVNRAKAAPRESFDDSAAVE